MTVVSPRFTLLGVAAALVFFACGTPPPPATSVPMEWQPVVSANSQLPPGVRAYSGVNDSLPLRAWYVRIDERDPGITTRVFMSDDQTDNRETVSSFARDLGACVAVNGGYFNMSATPARHGGLLLSNGVLLEPATRTVTRDSMQYEAVRAAIGFIGEEVQIAWVTTSAGLVYSWPAPPNHQPGIPGDPLDSETATIWAVRDALSAGPSLIKGGRIRITSDEEVFFGSSIPDVHPRSAAGRTEDGALLVMVVDGRHELSRGVYLEELATMMIDLGVVEALNLDGGGSSALVVNGALLNRPGGGTTEREVMSALVTTCR